MPWWQTWQVLAPLAWVTGWVLITVGTRRRRRNRFLRAPDSSCRRSGVESVP